MIVYYDNYSKQVFVDDENLNGNFNHIFTFLMNILGEEYITQNLVVDGNVALVYQEEPVEPSTIKSIDLFTNKRDIFLAFKNGIKFFNFEKFTIKNESISIQTISTIINFRYAPVEIETVNYNGIYLKEKSYI